MSALCLDADPFPLFALRDALPDLLLVHLFLEEVCREFGVALSLHVLQGCQVVAQRVFLLAERVTQVSSQRDERSSHDPVGDYLMVMSLEEEKDDARRKNEVPLLIIAISQITEGSNKI